MYNQNIIIVIPCFRVKDKILKVLDKVPNWINKVICVDDCCPENSGKFINDNITDNKVLTLFNKKNFRSWRSYNCWFFKSQRTWCRYYYKSRWRQSDES